MAILPTTPACPHQPLYLDDAITVRNAAIPYSPVLYITCTKINEVELFTMNV
jgi:hypothetical protein